MSSSPPPPENGGHVEAPASARAKARQRALRLLDATGQREKAKAARATFAELLTSAHIKSGVTTGDYLADWRRFMRLSTPFPPRRDDAGTPKRVAFVAPYGLFPPAIRGTAIITSALRERGVEVTALTCDRCLPACEATCVVDYEEAAEFLASDRPGPCARCYAGALEAFDSFHLGRLPLSAYSSPELRREADETAERFRDMPLDEVFAFHRDGVPLGQVIETSLYRFFLLGTLPDTPDVRAVALRYVRAAVEMAGIMDWFIETWKPDVILAHDGVYLIGGTSLAVAEAKGVDRIAWDVGYRRGSVLASRNGTFVREMRVDTSGSWNRPLGVKEAQALTIYLDGRQRGKMDDETHHPSPIEGREAVVKATGLQPGERLVSLFTNVVWDARVYAPMRIFDGPVEWMLETLRNLAPDPGVRYVVRVHPAETKISHVLTQERMDDQIREAFPDLPDNVVVISPEDDLSTYSLAAASDLAVVYSTQMGLESLAMGVQTVVAGSPIFSGKGLGIEPEDRESYYRLLNHPGDVPRMTADEIDLARRYAFYFFFRRMIILPDVVSTPRTGLPRIRDLRDLRPGRYTGIDTLCDGILNGTPFEADDAVALESILKGAVT